MKYRELREIINQKLKEGYEVKSLTNGCVQMQRGTNKIEVAPIGDDSNKYIIRDM